MPLKMTLLKLLIPLVLAGCLISACNNSTNPLGPLHVGFVKPASLAGIPDTVQTRYREDAAILTARILAQRPGSHPEQLHPELQENLFNALMHIYQADGYTQRDSVTVVHSIHAWPRPSVQNLRVYFAPDAPWAAAWAGNTPLSGHTAMDALINRYAMTIHVFYFWTPHQAAVLHAAAPWNMNAVAEAFDKVDGVISAAPDEKAVAGHDITAEAGPSYWTFSFQYRPGSGATCTRIWTFRVHYDGRVEALNGRSP